MRLARPHRRHPSIATPGASRIRRPSAAASVMGAAFLLLGGCGWVDSTGRQPDDVLPQVVVSLDEVAPGEALGFDEQKLATVTLEAGVTANAGASWSEVPLAEGAFDSCAAVPGFRAPIAAATLAEACSEPDPADCRFAFGAVEEASDARLVFTARVPRLRAPVGIRHELVVARGEEATASGVFDFCLIAINEGPVAVDDGPFVVREGEVLVVAPDDPRSLLANDGDDDDAGNLPLVVDPRPFSPPSSPGDFALGRDGGFRYVYPGSGLSSTFEDSFEYVVSDGSSSSRATVRINVEPGNLPPVLAEPLPPLEATVGEPFEAFLSEGFRDPEGRPLTFSIRQGLPTSGSLVLTPDGRLAGTPLREDAGDFEIVYVASDGASADEGGARETEARVTLSIVRPPNRPPVYLGGEIEDIVVGFGTVVSILAPEFVDPDGDELRYELVGDPPFGIELDEESGELSGFALQTGNFRNLRIRVFDPDGESARSARFTIRVRPF